MNTRDKRADNDSVMKAIIRKEEHIDGRRDVMDRNGHVENDGDGDAWLE